MQEPVDQFEESTYTRGGEVEFMVTELACGHYSQSPGITIGPAPGEPYVGPGRAVSRSLAPRDLLAATERQRLIDDPWREA